MAIPYDPFAARDKAPVSPQVPGTLPGTPFDAEMDSDVTKEDKDAFREIEKRKNPAAAQQDKRPSTVFTAPRDGSNKNGYLETILKQNLYHDGHKQGKTSDVHKPLKEYETSGPIHGADDTNTEINKQVKERSDEVYEIRKREEEELLVSFNKFKGESHGFDIGLRDKNFNNFQSQYDTSLQNLNANNNSGSNSVVDDTKTHDQITNIVDSGERKRYEDKYDHMDTSLNKITINRRLPTYNGLHQERVDRYNALSVLDSVEGTDKNLNRLPSKYGNLDFVPLYFHDLVNRKFIPFRSYIKSIDDQHDANWVETQYLGRADVVGVYQGFTRAVNLSFECMATHVEELHPMWQRINYLVGLTRPAGYTNEGEDGAISETYSSFIIPPIVEFNLGDIYLEQPVLIKSVGLTIPESNWETLNNEDHKLSDYRYLNQSIQRNAKVARYPMSCEITISMTLLEKNAPRTKQRHFGHNTEDGVAHYVRKDATKFNKNGPFNEQLIHYKSTEDYDTQEYTEPPQRTELQQREEQERQREQDAIQRQKDKNNQDISTPDNESATNNISIPPTPTSITNETDIHWVAIEYCGVPGNTNRPQVGIMQTDQLWSTNNGDVVTIDDWKFSGVSQGKMDGCYKFLVQMTLPESAMKDLGSVYSDYFKDELFKLGYLHGKYDASHNDQSEIVSNSVSVYSDCFDCNENKPSIPINIPISGGI
jgi:hypothetical protein